MILVFSLVLHPEAQKKAQAEIDQVVGHGRLPTFDDRSSLPYVEALYREIQRWRPVSTLGFPHTTIKGDVYKGYYIPKGVLLLLCADLTNGISRRHVGVAEYLVRCTALRIFDFVD